jgi:hypothetical protein
MPTHLLLGNQFIQESNKYIKKGNTLFILFDFRKSFNDIDFAMVPLA